MKYYVMIDGDRKGPVTLEELPALGVKPSTFVWCKGMEDWEKAEDVADICRFYRNRLYDIMHPVVNYPQNGTDTFQKDLPSQQITTASPTRFDKYLRDANQPPLPTVEEIDSRENTSIPPSFPIGFAWLVTFLCFPPTGIAAIVFAYKSKNAWKAGENKLAYDYNRAAKMWTGISFFMGLIVYAFLIRFL